MCSRQGPRLSARRGTFVHGLTYSGTPSSCFVGLRVHEIMAREGLFTRAAGIGGYLRTGLDGWPAPRNHRRSPWTGASCRAWSSSLTANPAPFAPAERSPSHRRSYARNDVFVAAGIPLANFGKDGDHIQISPPFTISEVEIDVLLSALDEALAAV